MRPQPNEIGLTGDAKARTLRDGPSLPVRQRVEMLERWSFGVTEGASLVGSNVQRLPSPGLVPWAVEHDARPRGLIDAFVKTCQRWMLSEPEQLVLLGYKDNEFFGTQILLGRWLVPTQDVRDRTGYILGISLGLGSIFNELAEAELRWLKAPHPKLGGRVPLAIMLEGKMSGLMAVAAVVGNERGL